MNIESRASRAASLSLRRQPRIAVIVETRDAGFVAAMTVQLRG